MSDYPAMFTHPIEDIKTPANPEAPAGFAYTDSGNLVRVGETHLINPDRPQQRAIRTIRAQDHEDVVGYDAAYAAHNDNESFEFATYLEPIKLLDLKSQRHPDIYLELNEESTDSTRFKRGGVPVADGVFNPAVYEYFTNGENYIPAADYNLLLYLDEYLSTARINQDNPQIEQLQALDIVNKIGNYFAQKAAALAQGTAEDLSVLPEEIKKLRRTALLVYKAARIPKINLYGGSSKAGIGPLGPIHTPYDQIVADVTNVANSSHWDGTVRNEIPPLVEPNSKIRLVPWDRWGSTSTHPFFRELGTDMVLPKSLKPLEQETTENHPLLRKILGPDCLPKALNKPNDETLYVEFVQNPFFVEGDKKGNTAAVLLLARMVAALAEKDIAFLDFKPDNFRLRERNTLNKKDFVFIDAGDIAQAEKPGIVTQEGLSAQGLGISHIYAPPELLARGGLKEELSIEKLAVYSIASMLVVGHYPEILNSLDRLDYKIENGKLYVKRAVPGQAGVQNLTTLAIDRFTEQNPEVQNDPFISLAKEALRLDPSKRIDLKNFVKKLRNLYKENFETRRTPVDKHPRPGRNKF